MSRHLAALALIPMLACASATSDEAPRAERPPAAAAPKDARPGDLTGVLVPATAVELSVWPEAFRGELLMLQVAAQGARVEAGEVLIELDARDVERQVADAEFGLRAAQVAHEALVAKGTLAEEAAQAALERARAALERARRGLEGWREHELALSALGDELAHARERNRVEDQEDELEQLQLMYAADELTDATEDLVLKRTRRDLELTRAFNGLSEGRRTYQNDYERSRTTAEREEAFAKQTLELGHLERSQALEARSRELAQQRSGRELETKREDLARLQRDRELFTLRAPRAGVFLHGAPDDYRPAAVPAPLERGAKLTPRSVVGHVADPHPAAVALELDAAAAAGLLEGQAVSVRAAGRTGGAPLAGRVRLTPYPTPGKGGPVWRARVELDAPAADLLAGMQASVSLSPAGRP